jgi:hypothetical protein
MKSDSAPFPKQCSRIISAMSPFLIAIAGILCCGGCASAKVETYISETGKQRATESILLLRPVARDIRLDATCETFGSYLKIEIPKRIEGETVYAKDIRELKNSLAWENIVVNGVINRQEVAAMANTVNCQSVIACRILEVKSYPPFRMVVEFLWIDSKTGDVIGKLFNDVDLSDSDTRYRYSNYVGEGPTKKLYERIFYSEDLFQTAYLSPNEFLHFVAAYSAKVLLSDKDSSFWNFWRIF